MIGCKIYSQTNGWLEYICWYKLVYRYRHLTVSLYIFNLHISMLMSYFQIVPLIFNIFTHTIFFTHLFFCAINNLYIIVSLNKKYNKMWYFYFLIINCWTLEFGSTLIHLQYSYLYEVGRKVLTCIVYIWLGVYYGIKFVTFQYFTNNFTSRGSTVMVEI